MSADGLVIVAGSPTAQTTGTVSTFLRDHTGNYVEGTLIVPIASNTAGFGQTVDLATDATSNDTLAVGAPASASGNGYVYIYNKSISSSLFTRGQVIVGNVGDSFGSSIAFNQDGEWLYVGAPGNNSVYAYGLNRFVPFAQQSRAAICLRGSCDSTLAHLAQPLHFQMQPMAQDKKLKGMIS